MGREIGNSKIKLKMLSTRRGLSESFKEKSHRGEGGTIMLGAL
jgi:hypothetical protein